MTINEHTLTSACVYYIGLQYIPSPCIFKMAVMLQIPRVFPHVSCLRSARAVQCPHPGPKIGDKDWRQILHYSPICPRGQPPRMAADKCINDCPKGNSFVSPKLEETLRLRIHKPQRFLRDQAQCFVIPLNSKLEKHYEEISCFTPAGSQICRDFKEHNLITCKSKVHVVVSLREVASFARPRESASLDPRHAARSPPIGKRI